MVPLPTNRVRMNLSRKLFIDRLFWLRYSGLSAAISQYLVYFLPLHNLDFLKIQGVEGEDVCPTLLDGAHCYNELFSLTEYLNDFRIIRFLKLIV